MYNYLPGSPFPLRVGSQHSRDKSNSPSNVWTSNSHHQESWSQDQSIRQGTLVTTKCGKIIVILIRIGLKITKYFK